jgi:hypothetical protein
VGGRGAIGAEKIRSGGDDRGARFGEVDGDGEKRGFVNRSGDWTWSAGSGVLVIRCGWAAAAEEKYQVPATPSEELCVRKQKKKNSR